LSLLSFFPCIIGLAEEPYFITSHLDAIALLAIRLGADHERVPSQGTEEVGFAKVGVVEVRIYTYLPQQYHQTVYMAKFYCNISSDWLRLLA